MQKVEKETFYPASFPISYTVETHCKSINVTPCRRWSKCFCLGLFYCVCVWFWFVFFSLPAIYAVWDSISYGKICIFLKLLQVRKKQILHCLGRRGEETRMCRCSALQSRWKATFTFYWSTQHKLVVAPILCLRSDLTVQSCQTRVHTHNLSGVFVAQCKGGSSFNCTSIWMFQVVFKSLITLIIKQQL